MHLREIMKMFFHKQFRQDLCNTFIVTAATASMLHHRKVWQKSILNCGSWYQAWIDCYEGLCTQSIKGSHFTSNNIFMWKCFRELSPLISGCLHLTKQTRFWSAWIMLLLTIWTSILGVWRIIYKNWHNWKKI